MQPRKKKSNSARYYVIVFCIFGAFAYLLSGLVELQIVNSETYAASAGTQSIKTVRTTGSRGMITDADSVILALSEDVYNVTFYRTADQNSSKEYADFTRSIIEAIGIIEKYGSQLCVDFVIKHDETTGEWTYDYGEGISEYAWATREAQWRGNHYLTDPKYDDPETAYEQLKKRYGFIDKDLSAQNTNAQQQEDKKTKKQIDEEAALTNVGEKTILQVMAVYSEMQMNLYNSQPVVIAQDVNFSAISEIGGRTMALSGIDINIGEKRVYPRGSLASQIIGYIGPITSYATYYDDLQPQGYSLTDMVGKDGIEYSMESWLTANISTRSGTIVYEKDSNGALTREISSTDAQDGNNVKLTLIASYQQAAERAIADNVENSRDVQEGKVVNATWLETNKDKIEYRDWDTYPLQLADTGVLIVLDIDNGDVLAMAQYPTFDLNALVAGGEEAEAILLDERGLLMNYAIHTRAEPGSVFKMVTGLASLTNKVITTTTTISDEGPFMKYTKNEDDAPTCWIAKSLRYKHQNQTIVQGLSNSCNYFFYTLGSLLYGDSGTTLLYKYAAEMGLTSKTGIDLPGEVRSIVGNQTVLYDTTVSLNEQLTSMPTLVAASIKEHLINVGVSYGISYNDDMLNTCIKRLMDMAVSTPSDNWADAMRPILMEELNMTQEMVWLQAVVGDIWIYLNDIKWGGSMEIQTAIGQGITLVTPAAVSRYIAALANGGTVYNLNIIDSIISSEGDIIQQRTANVFNVLEGVTEFLPYIRAGMKGVVDESGTAAKYFKDWAYSEEIWAKTGTSQVTIGGIKMDLENNAWFGALCPYDDPEIAVVCFIPNGYSGGEASLGVKEFIEWWMEDQNKSTGDTPVVPGNSLMP